MFVSEEIDYYSDNITMIQSSYGKLFLYNNNIYKEAKIKYVYIALYTVYLRRIKQEDKFGYAYCKY